MAITLPNGYTMTSTFFEDFQIADKFGVKGVEETFENAFNSWKCNHVYLTELAIVMSNNSIMHYVHGHMELSKTYTELYRKIDTYCMDNLKSEELQFYLKATD